MADGAIITGNGVVYIAGVPIVNSSLWFMYINTWGASLGIKNVGALIWGVNLVQYHRHAMFCTWTWNSYTLAQDNSRRLNQSHGILNDKHHVDPLQVLENSVTPFTSGGFGAYTS
ncbi:hypothetical protein VNO77_02157 [Canavalia gladiata]|uniref:Uncharacterized protein n=1 Tax=Canavalia gladiata TaxID=3824 RepID=A0AAN9MUH9_CANGL